MIFIQIKTAQLNLVLVRLVYSNITDRKQEIDSMTAGRSDVLLRFTCVLADFKHQKLLKC